MSLCIGNNEAVAGKALVCGKGPNGDICNQGPCIHRNKNGSTKRCTYNYPKRLSTDGSQCSAYQKKIILVVSQKSPNLKQPISAG